jgi:hypothetical protein
MNSSSSSSSTYVKNEPMKTEDDDVTLLSHSYSYSFKRTRKEETKESEPPHKMTTNAFGYILQSEFLGKTATLGAIAIAAYILSIDLTHPDTITDNSDRHHASQWLYRQNELNVYSITAFIREQSMAQFGSLVGLKENNMHLSLYNYQRGTKHHLLTEFDVLRGCTLLYPK